MAPDRLVELLNLWREGDGQALNEIFEVLHDDLHWLAAKIHRRRGLSETLRATVLLDELYLRLRKQREVPGDGRHMRAVSALLMNRIAQEALKLRSRRPWSKQITLEAGFVEGESQNLSLFFVAEAMTSLRSKFPRAHDIVSMKYWAGMTNAEIAEVLRISLRTAERELRLGKAYLRRFLKAHHGPGEEEVV